MFAKALITFSALCAAVVSATTCDSSELVKLVPIATNTNLSTCSSDSGYNLLAPTGLPDSATLAKMCASTACKALISAVVALNPTDCDLTIGSATINVYTLTSTFDSDCAALTTTPSTTSPTPAATTATPTTTTTTTSTDSTTTTSTTTSTDSSTTGATESSTANTTTTTTDAPLAC